MNSRIFSHAISVIITLIVGVMIIYEMITSKTSSIGKMYIYLSIASFILAFAKPQLMFFVLLFLTCYIDFFKRLMILGGFPTEIELAFFQAMPMLILLGATLSFVLPVFLGKSLSRDSIFWLFVSAVVLCVFLFSGGLTGSFLRRAGQAANASVYSLMLFALPFILDTTEKRLKYLRYSFYMFIPVALYMFKHYFFGLANFEYDYLMSGLSQESRIFTDDGDARRYFSTLNSSATVSTMLSVMALYGIVNMDSAFTKHADTQRIFVFACSLLFFAAAGLTLARTGWVCGLVAIVAYFFLGSRFRLLIGYSAGFFLFLLLLFSADYLIKYRILDDWQQFLVDYFGLSTKSANAERALVLGTMYDRLSGWRYLCTQPSGFPLLGTVFGGEVTVKLVDQYMLGHDIIVNYVSKLGWIPFSIIVICAGAFIRKLHLFHFSLSKKSIDFKLVRYCIASFCGILAGGLASGAQLFNFPQNFYFWFWLSLALTVYLEYLKNRKAMKQSVSSGAPLQTAVISTAN